MQVLGRQHPRAHRLVDALDARGIERAGGIADQQRARHFHARQRLRAAGGDGARAVGQQFAAVEQRAHRRMILQLLEGLEGLELRVGVIEADDQADVDAILLEVIDEAAAESVARHRPANRVLHEPGAAAAGRQLPQFLEAEREGGRRAIGVELVARDQLLADAAAAAFGKDA